MANSQGSLVVDAEAKLNMALEADVVSSVAKAVVDLQNQELDISGQTGTVQEVIVNNKTGEYDGRKQSKEQDFECFA